jgi:hypothetical protein
MNQGGLDEKDSGARHLGVDAFGHRDDCPERPFYLVTAARAGNVKLPAEYAK